VYLRVLLRESTGVEAGAATKFENAGAGGWVARRKKSVGDLLGMVTEEVLAAKGIKPGAGLE
jgi:hypothetical protein